MSSVLAGVGILITRPLAQAVSLAARVQAQGGVPVLFPTIEIAAPEDASALTACIARLPEFDLIVFVSPSAVEHAVPLFTARYPDWVRDCRVAAVGQGTRQSLQRHGIEKVIVPAGQAGAAGLLDMPEFTTPVPRHVLIVRGVGGRDDLAEGLKARGARVEYAECYRRVRPDADAEPLLERWRRGEVAAVTVTSVEILENLIALLGEPGAAYLRHTPMFVHHPRIAAAARARGIERVIETAPDEAGLVVAMQAYFARHG